MKPAKIRRRLDEAAEASRVVQVRRDVYGDERAEGYVLALTDDWLAMHVLADGVYLDSVLLMRLRDISLARDRHSGYVDRALAELSTPVATFTCPAGTTTRDLLLSAAELHPLSAFALGDEGEEQLMIGRLLKAGRKRIRHRFIRPDGTWVDEVDEWTYDQIASIQIGGRYIDSLAQFGDPCPDDEATTQVAAASPPVEP